MMSSAPENRPAGAPPRPPPPGSPPGVAWAERAAGGRILRGEAAHQSQGLVGLGVAARGGQRQRAMGRGEGAGVIAHPRRGEIGDGRPAVADIDAAQFQPLQQGDVVLDVDAEIRQRLHQRAVEIAQARVVDLQRRRIIPGLGVEQREMPPVVVAHVVDVIPVTGQPAEKRHAVRQPRLHHQNMRDRMGGPGVRGVALDGLAAAAFGAGVIPRLLQPEGADGEVGAVALRLRRPVRRGAFGDVAHPVDLADPEQFELREPERQQILRRRPRDALILRGGPVMRPASAASSAAR
jgi:hypothetical protein